MKLSSVLVGICAASLCQAASATTIFSWDNEPQGWSGIDGYSTTIGVTHGTHSAMENPPAGFAWPNQTGNWNPLFPGMNDLQKTSQYLLIDVTATPQELPEAGFYFLDFWVWYSIDGSATQSGIGQLPVIMDGQTHTYAFDFKTAGKGGAANIEWTQLRLTTNSSNGENNRFDPDVMYFDNLRITNVIPEPAGLAVLGMVGMGLFGRRRRA